MLYKQVLEARNELKKCQMVRGPYSDLFIPYHITDMSIVRNEEDINEKPVRLDFYEASNMHSETESISTVRQSDIAVNMVSNLKGTNPNRTRKLIDDLSEQVRLKDIKILGLSKELKKTSLNQGESQNKDRKIQNLIEEINERDKTVKVLKKRIDDLEAFIHSLEKKAKFLEKLQSTPRLGTDEVKTTKEDLSEENAETKEIINKLIQKFRSDIHEEDKNDGRQKDSKNEAEQNKSKLNEAQHMYEQIKKRNEKFDQTFIYGINMINKSDLQILEYTSEVKLPRIKKLAIVKPPLMIDSRLKKLLKHSFPNSLKQFFINWSDNLSLMSDYIDALTSIISKTTAKVSFHCPRMDYDEFSLILMAAKNTDTVIFDRLKLSK